MRPGKAIILVIAVLGLTPWLSMTRYGRAVWSKDDIADAEYNGWALKEGGILKVAPTLVGHVENRFAEVALKRLAADGGARESQKVPARR